MAKKILIIGGSASDQSLTAPVRELFNDRAPTGWTADIASVGPVYNPFDPPASDDPNALPEPEGVVLYYEDKSTYLEEILAFAIEKGYRMVLVSGVGTRYSQKVMWDKFAEAGIQVVLPFGVDVSSEEVVQPSLYSAITVGGGFEVNEFAFGNGLEFIDSTDSSDSSQLYSPVQTALRLAFIRENNATYTMWDARQHLRQVSGAYPAWSKEEGYGRAGGWRGAGTEDEDPVSYISLGPLDIAPPLACKVVKESDNQRVTATWDVFPQTVASGSPMLFRVIDEADVVVYEGLDNRFKWVSTLVGDKTFRIRQVNPDTTVESADTDYTTFEITGLTVFKAIRYSLNVTERVLRVAKKVATTVLNALAKPMGFRAEIYYPIKNRSVYGASDSTIFYDINPDLRGFYVFTGMISERYASDVTLDVYGGSPAVFLYMPSGIKVPENSRVVVRLSRTNVFAFSVLNVKGIEGVDAQVFQKLALVPLPNYSE